MTIKLFAFDIDGTILNPMNLMTESTRKSLISAYKEGITLVPVTGRCFTALPTEIFSLGDDGIIDYVITSNGAKIHSLKYKRNIYSNCINKKGVYQVITALNNFSVMTEVYVNDKPYIDKSYYSLIQEGKIGYRNQEYVLSTRIPIENVFMILHQCPLNIEKVAVYYDRRRGREDVVDSLKNITEAQLTASSPRSNEIIGKKSGKHKALKFLCGHLKISMNEVMSIGDSYNDFEMLAASGISVAMGNAEKAIKDIATHITLSNQDNGASKAINKYILNRR